MNQESRTIIAAMLLVTALFVIMNRVVTAAPLGDWWLALALITVGIGFALSTRLDFARGLTVAEVAELQPALATPRTQVFELNATASAAEQLTSAQAAPILPMGDASTSAVETADLDIDEAVIVTEPAPPPMDDAPTDDAPTDPVIPPATTNEG